VIGLCVANAARHVYLHDNVVGTLGLAVVDPAQARELVDDNIHLSTVLIPKAGEELCQLLPQANLQQVDRMIRAVADNRNNPKSEGCKEGGRGRRGGGVKWKQGREEEKVEDDEKKKCRKEKKEEKRRKLRGESEGEEEDYAEEEDDEEGKGKRSRSRSSRKRRKR